ncbi:uncharacterized protein [Coffea arabica]|uniref:Expansin-like CBD domain-containing protein n=1 Tax=Coffea arabica TaxID=13443 RepID=A0A6P6SNQ3_COFAR|nr:uncharacterized protein LOC113693165 [Coffea arabica]
MKVAVWNCQGAGGPLTISQLKEVLHLHFPNIMFLCETKNQERYMKQVQKRVNFENRFVVNPKGRAGGLALFWKEDVVLLGVQGSDWYIAAIVVEKETNDDWWLVGIYASTEDRVRKHQWKTIEEKKREWGEKWAVMGDFNDISSNGEKWGGRERSEGSFRDFNNFISGNELVDIGFVGVPWTWSNTWDGKGEVKERLDRCLGSVGWMQLHENVTCEHIEKRHLIIASLWWTQTRNKGEVKEGFSSTKDGQKTKHLKWTAKGNAKAKIQEIKEQLKATRECNKGVITTLKRQLSKAYKDEKLYWSQKSRSRWLEEGDKNTAYFHQSVMAKRKRNRISILQKTDGEWCRSDQEIEEELCTHYKELFTSNNPTEFDEVLQGIPCTISNLMNAQLIKPVDELEIKQGIFSMFPNKAPGVDGRQILDIVIIAHELLHFLKSKRFGKVGFMTIKLDMSKAHDRVEWKFLDDSLLCCKASKQEAQKIKEIIQLYGKTTG